MLRNMVTGDGGEYGEGKGERVEFSAVKGLLDCGEAAGVPVRSKDGFYFLPGSQHLAENRPHQLRESQRKISLAKRRLSRILPFTPFILGVALEGSTAEGRARPESDIDLLVICQNGRIWTARAVFDRLNYLLGWRRAGSQVRDRFCLNHYLTPADLKVEPGLYHAFLHSHLIPLYEAELGLWQEFFRANPWINQFLPNHRPPGRTNKAGQAELGTGKLDPKSQAAIKLGRLGRTSQRLAKLPLSGFVGGLIEGLNRALQQRIIARNPLTYQKGGRVRADDKQLEFHPRLIETSLQRALQKRLKTLALPS